MRKDVKDEFSDRFMSQIRILAGTLRNRKLATPKGLHTRPTSAALRKALFDICKNIIDDANILDLFAGSGALSIEALSRGAKSATCVDNNKEALRCIRHNIKNLQLQDHVELLYGDVFRIIKALVQQQHHYDIIIADPPYGATLDKEGMSYAQYLLRILDNSSLLSSKGMLFIECSRSDIIDKENLSSLFLVSSRRIGRSTLHQFSC